MKQTRNLWILLLMIVWLGASGMTEDVRAAEKKTGSSRAGRYLVSCNGNYRNKWNTLGRYQTLEEACRVIRRQRKAWRDEWYVYDLEQKGRTVWPELKDKKDRIKRAVAWARSVAADPRHGYSCYGEKTASNLKVMWDRWGRYGDYSCSTFVITAFELAGFADLRSVAAKHKLKILQTGMKGINSTCLAAALKKSGKFKNITKHVKGKNSLRAGDVLVSTYHAALYIGGGKLAEASMNELGREYARAKPGDQTGGEIRVRSYYGGWSGFYRPIA